MAMNEAERRKLWIRAGGRCSLCKKDLMRGSLTWQELVLGEGAHIVGQKRGARSPRGDSPLSTEKRDLAANIILLCSNCHSEIDKQLAAAVMTVEQLRLRKLQHEDEIAHLTSLVFDRRSTVLRVFGHIKDASVVLDQAEAAQAVIHSGERFPMFLRSFNQHGIEVDLRRLAGETDAASIYYAAAAGMIDSGLTQIRQGVESGDVVHLSVFAIARLPLLVLLGARLDDAVPTDIYQRHRASDGWQWPTDGPKRTFSVTVLKTGRDAPLDGALIVNLSGTTPLSKLPSSLHDGPVWQLSVDEPGEDVIAARETLAGFEATVRQFFTELEASHACLARLHLFGPIPVSAAVVFGRALKAPDLRPRVVTYDWTADGYRRALEV